MRIIYSCLIISCICLLSACVEDKKATEDYVNQIKNSAVGAVEKIPPNKQYKTVDYTAENLRNPFIATRQPQQPVNVVQQPIETKNALVQQPRPDAKRPREYLEQFPLSSFVMVGTLSKPEMNWGLIKDGNGMIYAVKNGDYLGQNSGKIVAITPDQIRVVETVPNGAGGWMRAKATIMLVPEGTK
jgi:type IV pilus assembly protein PilP